MRFTILLLLMAGNGLWANDFWLAPSSQGGKDC
jgi:hypothetical protein